MSEVTRILSAIEHGDTRAAEKLLPLVYDELRDFGAAQDDREKIRPRACEGSWDTRGRIAPLYADRAGVGSLSALRRPGLSERPGPSSRA